MKDRFSARIASSLVVASLVAISFWLLPLSPKDVRADGVASHDYVGAETCRSCHVEEYNIWAAGPHAKALTVLSESERQDRRCLQCHTMVTDDLGAGLVGIQCETCHGAGRYYSSEHVMRDSDLRSRLLYVEPNEKTCVACHTEDSPSMKPFSYPEMLKRIQHWE
jgi:hypothetical protein